MHLTKVFFPLAALLVAASPALAQQSGVSGDASAPDSAQETTAAQSSAAEPGGAVDEEDSLKVFFETGEAGLGPQQVDVLDQAARLFREGNPYVMILSGAADTTGPAETNLDLSLARARSVAAGLEARGIPVDRLQILGRGNTDLPVETGPGVSEQQNRVVEITWR